MKRILILVLFMLTLPAMGGNKIKDKYHKCLKEKLSVSVTIPDEYCCVDTCLEIYFGHMLKEFPTVPFFDGGLIIKQSKYSTILMMDIEKLQKPIAKYYPPDRDYLFPEATGWMLNNCDTPWAYWYIDNIRGVRIDSSDEDKNGVIWDMPLSENELRVLQERVVALRMEYERCFENCELTQKTNSDRVFIVKIPNIDKIKTFPHWFENICPKIEIELKFNATECFGVEFYKHTSIEPLKMLFFVNTDGSTIDECVAEMAEYIKFY